MTLFGHRRASYLGVDFGSSGLKAVELSGERGKPTLVTYGMTEVSADIVRNASPEARDRAVASLVALVQGARVTTRKAVAALPNYAVFSSVIALPPMSERDMAAAVRWEAKKFVPLPLEEMILDWKQLGTLAGPAAGHGKAKPEVKVLLTAAPKSLVSRYIEVFKLAKMELLSLETEAFALARALIGPGSGPVMIIDMGAYTTDLAVVEDGIPTINRSIDVGGSTLTKAIANSLSITEQRAEQFKRDFGLAMAGGESGIPRTIEAALAPVLNEVKYVFDLYQGQSSRPVEKVTITGGSAYLPHLSEFLQKLLGVPTYVGDPWDRVSYPLDVKPALEEVGPTLVVAIGLALRELAG